MKLQEPCSLSWEIPSTECLCPAGPAPLPRPAQEAWPRHRAACPKQGPAEKAFSFMPLGMPRNAALLFPRAIPAPREPCPGQCVRAGLSCCCCFPPRAPHRAPSWWCCSVKPGSCDALGPPGDSPVPMLLRVGSRPKSVGLSAAEPLSICPGVSAAQGSAWQGRGVSLSDERAGKWCIRSNSGAFKEAVLNHS